MKSAKQTSLLKSTGPGTRYITTDNNFIKRVQQTTSKTRGNNQGKQPGKTGRFNEIISCFVGFVKGTGSRDFFALVLFLNQLILVKDFLGHFAFFHFFMELLDFKNDSLVLRKGGSCSSAQLHRFWQYGLVASTMA